MNTRHIFLKVIFNSTFSLIKSYSVFRSELTAVLSHPLLALVSLDYFHSFNQGRIASLCPSTNNLAADSSSSIPI